MSWVETSCYSAQTSFRPDDTIRVLHIDDSRHDQELIRNALMHSTRSYYIFTAETEAEFNQQLKENHFDLVLSDFNILGYDGLDVLDAVRQQAPDLPVVIVTGTGSEEIAVEALRRGAAEYVIKSPDHIRHLPHTLDVVLEKKQLQIEKEQALLALKRAKEQSERIIEQNVDGMLVLDHLGNIVFANTAAFALIGTQDVGLAKTVLALSEDAKTPVEVDIVGVDGQQRCIEFRVTSLEWEARNARLVSLRDITERKRSAEHIDHLNRILRAIRKINQLIVKENSIDALLSKACQALVETRGYNSAWTVILDGEDKVGHAAGAGVPENPETLLGMPISALPICARRVLESAAPHVHVFPDSHAFRRDCPLGLPGEWGEVMACALIGEDRRRGVLIASLPKDMSADKEEQALFTELAGDIAFAVRDIELVGAQTKADKALRESRDALEEAQRVAGIGSWSYDIATDTLAWTKQMFRILGVDPAVGEPTWEGHEHFLHPDDWPRFDLAVKRAIVDGRPYNEVCRIVHKDGSIRWGHTKGHALKNENGQIVRLIGTVQDITERREMEAQLTQADRLSSMGMLAAGVAHEINNPLMYILYNLDTLADDLPDLIEVVRLLQYQIETQLAPAMFSDIIGPSLQKLDSERIDDIVNRFRHTLKGTERIRDIVRGLSTFSRVEKDDLILVYLEQVVNAAINMAFNEIKYRARLVKQLEKTPPVMASEGRLAQVFLNLLINATHAIHDGDVDHNEIRVRTWSCDDSVFAEVRDTGAGIPEEHMDKLFDPFFTTKEAGQGSGLGLAISKNIIESLKGAISVTSVPGEGSTFTVRLPIPCSDAVSVKPSAAVSDVPRLRGRVLIVDDEEAIRDTLAHLLSGHDIVQARDGAEVLEILANDQSFDVIVCDMMMPRVSGLDVHQWLVTTHPILARRLVFISGGAFTPKTREYLMTVENIKLEKPFELAKFKKIISNLICEARQGDTRDEEV